MKLRYLSVAGLLFTVGAASAASFEAAGVVQRVDVEHNLIEVDDQLYGLSNQIVESGNPGAGPALFQLRAGMSLTFSGETGVRPTITSIYIHSPRQHLDLQRP